MSKIHLALEKAERERELKQEIPPPVEMPRFEDKEKNVGRQIISFYAPVSPASEPLGETDAKPPTGRELERQLVSFHEPGSLAAEQFRKLRTMVFKVMSRRPLRTIMVTSTASGEGKSLVAANLAIGIANDLHAQALLVDCDLRRPTVAEWFGIKGRRGISDYLEGGSDLDALFVKTEIERLKVLPAGRIPDNPAELFGSKKMETLIRELRSREKDHFVIFDSTPILATTEPQVLSKLVDGIIFVVRAGVTPREMVKQALGSIEKEKIIGTVLNGLEFKSTGLHSRYFGANGYYYHYGYGAKKDQQKARRSWRDHLNPLEWKKRVS